MRTNKCCLCGQEIYRVLHAIRDYQNETYWEWIQRHILTVLMLRTHKEDGSMPVCHLCYWKAKQRIEKL